MKKGIAVAVGLFLILTGWCQYQATINIDVTKQGSRISPTLHGIFFEEISHAGEGGMYAEMIQ
ncbi:MAG TPA: hypothetical protein VJ111_01925, partial [Chitinophagaceae bacterium]|nr:hypothetical protein [Chitinophagaceae bacterium]